MPSLIPAEVMEQALARRGQVQVQPTGMAPGFMDNPSMRLQNAHTMGVQRAQRGQTSTPQSGPGGQGPMTSSVYKSMLLDAFSPDDQHKQQYQHLVQDPKTSPQMLHQLLTAQRQNRQAQPQQEQQVNPQAGQMSIGTKDQTKPETGNFKLPPEYAGMAQHSLFAKQAQQKAFQGSKPPAPAPSKDQLAKQQADSRATQQAQQQQFSREHMLLGELHTQQKDMETNGMQDQPAYKQLTQQIEQIQQRHQKEATPTEITDPSQVASIPSGTTVIYQGHIFRKP